MKIAYVITRADVIGGASVHLLDLAAGAQRRGHEVVLMVGGQGIVMDRAGQMGLPCISLKHLVRPISPMQDLLGFFELRRQLKIFAPDIVHLHSSKAGILGRLAAKTLSIPAIFTAHGWAFTEGIAPFSRLLCKIIEKCMAPLAARIITVSEYDKSLALQAGVSNPRLITAIHNGMPVLAPPQPENHRSPIASQPPDQQTPGKSPSQNQSQTTYFEGKPARQPVKMIMVARFDPQKNQSDLLDALARLPPSPPWVMEFVGDGPLLASMKEKATVLALQDHIVFSGTRKDVADRLRDSDVFILASNWEGLPLSILEAMRAGLPVIASNVGGVSEAVVNGDTGYLVNRHDVAALALAAQQLIANPELRQSMGESGHRRFIQAFTFDKMLDSTLAVYDSALVAQ